MGKRCPNHLRDIGEGEEKVLRVGERNWKVGESMVGGDSRRRRRRVEMWPCSLSEQGEGRPESAKAPCCPRMNHRLAPRDEKRFPLLFLPSYTGVWLLGTQIRAVMRSMLQAGGLNMRHDAMLPGGVAASGPRCISPFYILLLLLLPTLPSLPARR